MDGIKLGGFLQSQGFTIYKYYLVGFGQTVASYVGENGKKFTHKKLDEGWLKGIKRRKGENARKL
jgi:hypothetical protein